MNKRQFLKSLLLLFPTGGLLGILAGWAGAKEAGKTDAAAGAAGRQDNNAEGNAKYHPRRHWYGMGIEIDKCIGCSRCVDACKAENAVPREPFFFRT